MARRSRALVNLPDSGLKQEIAFPTRREGYLCAWPRSEKAFTLFELLAILGIVLVVCACMTPMLLHARAESRREQCITNLHQVSAAIFLYAAGNDDTLPMAYYQKSPKISHFSTFNIMRSHDVLWADLMLLYQPDFQSYVCPSDEIKTNWLTDQNAKPSSRPLSYALNAYFYIQPGVKRQGLTGGGLSEVPDINTKLLLVESTPGGSTELAVPFSPSTTGAVVARKRHLGGANWTFGDGHAEFHLPPSSWQTAPFKTWIDPLLAAKQPYPQWFPWVTGKPNWH